MTYFRAAVTYVNRTYPDRSHTIQADPDTFDSLRDAIAYIDSLPLALPVGFSAGDHLKHAGGGVWLGHLHDFIFYVKQYP